MPRTTEDVHAFMVPQILLAPSTIIFFSDLRPFSLVVVPVSSCVDLGSRRLAESPDPEVASLAFGCLRAPRPAVRL